MGSAERYEIAPVTLPYGATPTDLDLAQMQNFQISPSVQRSRVRAGGDVDALAIMVGRAKPQITFGTRDLATIFTQLSPIAGLCVTGPAIFRELERDDCAVWTGAGMKHTAAGGGFVYPTTLTANMDDTDGALLTSMFMPYYDGTNPPIASAVEADMSGEPAAAFGSQFFLGPVYRNAAEVRGITSSSIDFGLTVTGTPLTPGPYDRVTAITDRQPTFTFTTSKSDAQLINFGECDTFSIYYQKGLSCSDRVPYATAEHLKISCTVGFVEVTDRGGDAASDAITNITIVPVGPIALSVASAIP